MTTDGYESPIKVYQLIDNQYSIVENKVFEVVKAMDVNVDKEELFKALAYDRNKYEEGYEAGYKRAIKDITESSCFTMRSPTSEELELIEKYWK